MKLVTTGFMETGETFESNLNQRLGLPCLKPFSGSHSTHSTQN